MFLLLTMSAFADETAPVVEVDPLALLQLWGTAYDMDENVQADSTGYGDPEDDPGLKVKRARLGLRAHAGEFTARLMGGASASYDAWDEDHGDFALYEASVQWERKWFEVEAGLQGMPFSRDNLMPAGELTFEERGIAAEHVSEDRGMGLVARAHGAGVTGQIGVFNSGYTPFGDDNVGKALVARAEYQLGDRDTYALWGGKEGFGLGVGASGMYEMDVSTNTVAAELDAVVRAGPVSALAEGSYASVSPTATDVSAPGVWDPTTRLGVTAEVNVGIGRFQPAARVSWFSDSALGSWTQVLGGVVAHVGPKGNQDLVRVGAGYVLRLESDPVPNDTVRLWGQFWLKRKG